MSRRPERFRAAALLVAVSLALVGCGASPATRAQVVRRANAICFATQQSIRGTPAPAGGLSTANLPGLATYFSRVAPLLQKQAMQLRALPRPAADRATLDAFISAAARTAADYTRLAAAARRHDASGAARALSDLGGVPTTRLAAAYGLTQCTGTSGTSS